MEARTASGEVTSPARTLGSKLTSALPSVRTRPTRSAMCREPGGVQLEIEPTCTIRVSAGQARSSSAGVHCQSAAPLVWKE
jgi:hypothetical protein